VRDPARDLNVGYFAQHQLEQLRPEWSPLQHLLAEHPAAPEQVLRDFLGGFGFAGDQALAPVAPFSGGEKARLVLALIVYRRPNLLLLDEPTNHLDLEMRHALSLALQGFDGALVLVSHDRALLRATADVLWLVHGGRVAEFPEALDDYPRWVAAQRAQLDRATAAGAAGDHTAAARKDRRRTEAEERRRLQPLRQRVDQWEHAIARLGAEHAAVEQRLADPGLYREEQKEALKGILTEKARLVAAVSQAEAAWLEAAAALEAAASE
jgi:ATP-binding cassette subfamily F protein 3